MTKEQLTMVGEALHGTLWMVPLAKDLDIGMRTMERWRSGAIALPKALAAECADLLIAKISALQSCMKETRK